ncbi:antitoxin ParD1/3/4 [Rhizobium sp. ERR 922]|uniref:type II toxin-antitoxin system ParD family antitoxin n=1 Tax=unclassified Rhizobium TaxID=2613769 RepID=UPI0011A059B1|nr:MULTISPECIES: type II toxin-antitoxin system ParD family antitoxin [unclassified Rhizobium]TWB53180.1 antitoxin ParD1/3/4 [Rhizobium sp. ERR 922]TWB95855.1 antitoxin ParD1/3/4 [Rhizobium sp. ERR 942]
MASFALNEHYERFIKRQIESGRYNNASEVVRAALRLLEDQEDARERWLTQEIPSRYADLKRDPSAGVTLDEAFDQLEAEHRAQLAKTQ